jgi:hypothetical protein
MENNTVTQKEEGSVNGTSNHIEKTIKTPVFIIFAEYLGYVSRFNDIAIAWCEGKIPEEYVQKLLTMEAKSIFRQMKKDYTIEDIQYWYDTYSPIILNEYEEKLIKAMVALAYDDD